jgi:hypothetical protein
MINLVILEGELARAPFMGKTTTGLKKASFTIKTDQYVEVEAIGRNAELLENCKGGEIVNVTGSVRKYKSKKYDCYMLSISASIVKLVEDTHESKQTQVEESEPEISYEISFDDLPF